MQASVCCGKEMKITIDTSMFLELHCDTCKDFIYVKKDNRLEPQLIDD